MRTFAGFVLITLVALGAHAQDEPRVRTAAVPGTEQPSRVVDGLPIGARDEVVLETAEEVVRRAVPTGYRPDGSPCLWPNGVIPYVIDDNVPQRERLEVLKAVRTWDTETVLRFVERTARHPNYVHFTIGPVSGSTNWCGRGGPIGVHWQVVEVPDSADNLLHVLGHTIGLEHENQRRDRDRWLTVFGNNIAETSLARSAWHPKLSTGPDIGPYDYRSIMHYRFIEPLKQRNHGRPYSADTIPPGMPFGAAVRGAGGSVPERVALGGDRAGLRPVLRRAAG